jgi:hypothetical protein
VLKRLKKRAPAGCQRATRRTNAGNVTGLAGSELQEPYTRYAINALSGTSTLAACTTYVVEILLEDSGNPVDNSAETLAAKWGEHCRRPGARPAATGTFNRAHLVQDCRT